MTQLMPLPLNVSCFSEIQTGFTFLVPAHLGSPGKRAVKRVCFSCTLVRIDHYKPPPGFTLYGLGATGGEFLFLAISIIGKTCKATQSNQRRILASN